MKRTFATLAVILVLALCLSVPAFAEDAHISNDGGTDTVPVNGVYNPGATASTVVSVDVSWGTMSFTYNGASEGEWDEENHSYINQSEAKWTCEQDANKITVTNHSNTAIEANLSFTAQEGASVTGTFTDAEGADIANKINLRTAEGTAVSEAPKADAYFNVSGTISSNGALGTITVTVVSK